jgi:predicted dehydrogenase
MRELKAPMSLAFLAGIGSARKLPQKSVTQKRSALPDDPNVDAIDVCLPTSNHAEFVVAALEHGKHVFCETPFALTFTEAEAMLEAAKDADRIFMAGLLERSIAQYEYAYQAAVAHSQRCNP